MIDNLPKGWTLATIPQLVRKDGLFSDGDWVESKDQDPSGEVRLIQLADIGETTFRNRSDRYLTDSKANKLNCSFLQKDDILVARMPDPLGRACLFPLTGKYVTVVDVAIIRPACDPHWLMYVINSPNFRNEILKNASGSTRLRISRRNLGLIQFPAPPLPEQKRIVAKLDALFGHLDTLKTKLDRIPELLKNFRQQVLTQAVTGKLTEEWREGKDLGTTPVNDIISRKQNQVNNENSLLEESGRKRQKLNEFVFHGYNEIGWLKTDVESASVFIIDCLHDTAKFSSQGNLLVDTNCIEPFKIIYEKARRVTSEVYEKWISRLKPKAGDILFSREGTIGISVKVPQNVELCIGQRMMLFRFFDEVLLPGYAEISLNSSHFRNQYLPLIKGATAQHLNIRDIRKLKISLPSIEEQVQIIRRVNSLFDLAESIEFQYQSLKDKLDNLPQAILNKAFKGELVPQDPNDEPAEVLLERVDT